MLRAGLNFSHIGLFVAAIDVMEDFYVRVMEFTVTDRGPLETPAGVRNLVFLSRDPDEHHQVVLVSGRPQVLDFNPVNQISFRADSLATLRSMHRRLADYGVEELVTVTHGNALSVYARDPEGNRLELFVDTPWYVDQPMRVAVDLSLGDADLMAVLERHASALPGFRPRAVWRAEMARRMGLPE
jgi:catechol-2,3-dioxygenase